MLTTENTRPDFEASSCRIAVLPIGAMEQHGPHLPVGTDTILAEALARAIAQHLDACLLPPLAITASIEHRKAKGTVYLRAPTLALVVRDIAESLRGAGFRQLVLVNFHGGNWILKPTIRELNRDLAGFRVVLLVPDLPPADAREILEHPTGDIHAGELETSLMLHLHPEKVRPPPLRGSRLYPPQPFLDYFDASELTPEGYWGWPEAATAEKGRRAFEALLAASLRFLAQIEEMDRAIAARSRVDVRLRQMNAADIPFANELRQLAGWNQTPKDWQGYLGYDPEGCFVAEVGGRPAGTATTIRYGDRFGWIGMVLVHPEQRRHGIGTALLNHSIARLHQCRVSCIKLDATPLGKKVYVPLGFVDEYELSRYEGDAPLVSAPAASELVPFSAVDFSAVVQLDATAFGSDRPKVLASLAGRDPELCFAWRENGTIVGYLIARVGANAIQVGPWSAGNADVAEKLLLALFARVGGRRIFIDVIAPNPAASATVKKHGFSVQRTLTRMFLGENAHPGDTQLVYGISSPEKG